MATLQIPKAVWQSAPDSRITSITTNKEGDRIIAGMSNGTIIIFRWDPIEEQIYPDIYCIGPPAPVVAILCYQIELEECSNRDNVFVTVTDTGDIALWHLKDGQCLQTRHEKNDGVQGILQGVQVFIRNY